MSPIGREVLRKLVHLVQLPILIGYTLVTLWISKRIGLLSLTALLLVLLEIEYVRLEYKPKITQEISKFVEKFILRKHERDNVVSAIFYLSACIIAFSVFDYSIALLALLLTTFGDLVAALTGLVWGKKKIFKKKTYVGTFFGLMANLTVGYFVIGEYPQIFISMAFIAGIVETLTQRLDDNLTVPLFAGFAGQLMVFILDIQLPGIFGVQ